MSAKSHQRSFGLMPLPTSVQVQHTHHACSHCRVSSKLSFVSQTQRAQPWLQFAQAINADAEVLRVAVCNRCPARYGTAEDVMTASLSSCTQQVLAVNFSQLDTKLVTATERHQLSGLVQAKTHVWHGMISRCRLTVFMLQPIT